MPRDDATTVTCPPGAADRLDRVLARLLPATSRGAARRLIADGRVFVNKQRCKVASRTIWPGTVLRVTGTTGSAADATAPAAATGATPAAASMLPILYEDADLIAIDKPAGMPASPTRTAAAGTAQTELEHQLRARDGNGTRLFVVHRLDAGTSGVLLFAKTGAAAAALGAAFSESRVEKVYLARVPGTPATPHGTIDLPLATVGRKTIVSASGRPARTDWELVATDGRSSLLRLRPETGRMHQLRVHLNAIGHPIAGDRLYGGPAAPRLMLHAERLVVPHPSTTAPLALHAACSFE